MSQDGTHMQTGSGSEGSLDHNNVGSSTPQLTLRMSSHHSSSTHLFGFNISPNQRSTNDNITASNNYQNSTNNSSFRRFEVGESSRAGAQVGNPRPSTPPIIGNSSMRFFEYNMTATSMPHIQIGMGMSSTWAPLHLMSRSNFNANTHQHRRILPSPFGFQLNHFLPMFRNNQLLMSVAWNNASGNFEHILTSTTLELRNHRNWLRDQILRAQEQLRNSGPGIAEDFLITEYSMALNMLDEQERLDVEEERLEQLEGDAWRYETERALEEEEIITRIRHDLFESNPEDTENEKCAICQEDWVYGEHIGRLDCNHTFHFKCIKEWLMQKNACPICKQTALYFPSSDDENDG